MDNVRIVWRDKFAIGDSTNDAQHRRLIELIAGLPQRASPGDSALVQEMLAYAERHFRDEEELMERVGFPGLAAHRDSHQTLTRTLLSYRRSLERGETDHYAFKQFAFNWVRDHILDEDQAIGRFLAAVRGRPGGAPFGR